MVVSEEVKKSLQEEMSLPIIRADRVMKSAEEAESFKLECAELAKQVDRLFEILRSWVRLATSAQSLYERPIRLVAEDVTRNLDRALSLVLKCNHAGFWYPLLYITTVAEFKRVSGLLESSIGDMRWLLNMFDSDGSNISLPPIACNDPVLPWIWSSIWTVQASMKTEDRVDAAKQLASLACDSHRNKKMIVEEGGILPLLKLLKEGGSAEAQIAAVNVLSNIATDEETVSSIVVVSVPIFEEVLGESSSMEVQTAVVNLVARMAERYSIAHEEFIRGNVTRRLISLLCMDVVVSDYPQHQLGKNSVHPIIQISKVMADKSTDKISQQTGTSTSEVHFHGSSPCETEEQVESSEVKLELRTACAEALWKLSRESLSGSREITKTKGLLRLAKMIEIEKGDLQLTCLMTIAEVTAMAESNSEFRHAAFKNTYAAKAILNQLLRVVKEEDGLLQILAIKSIGCLARTFTAKESPKIVAPLVAQLGSSDFDVAMEAAIALKNFVSPDNFKSSEHSKAVIECDGVRLLMKFSMINDVRAQVHGHILMCYLALSDGNSKALEEAGALNALKHAELSLVPHHPELKDLFEKTICRLTLYQAGVHPITIDILMGHRTPET